MKILAYTESYAGVTITFIVNELLELEKKNDLLLIYSSRVNPNNYLLKQMIEIPFYFNRVVNKLRWWLEKSEIYFTLFNYRFKRTLNKTISDFKPDLIHCHFGTDFLNFYANLSQEHRKTPILISFYGYDANERILNKSVLRKYQRFMMFENIYSIAVSKSLCENINRSIRPKNDCELIHSGVDTDFFVRKPNLTNENVFTFLQVSSFQERKGHKYTLEAFKRFIDLSESKPYYFIIVGLGELEGEIKDQIKALQLSNFVEVREPITPAEMVELSSKVNCFVHMSVTTKNGQMEGLPNVILEAMSLELPIMATLHAGIPEIVEHGKNGILCEERSIEEYVEAFKTIVTWKPLSINREKIIEQFSLKSHMKKLFVIYDELTKRKVWS